MQLAEEVRFEIYFRKIGVTRKYPLRGYILGSEAPGTLGVNA